MKLSLLLIFVLSMVVFLILRRGWVVLWDGFFVSVLIVTMVFLQKNVGKIEGLLIAVIPFIAGKLLIKNNRSVQQYYFSKQMKFINWCNKYIYNLSKEVKKK